MHRQSCSEHTTMFFNAHPSVNPELSCHFSNFEIGFGSHTHSFWRVDDQDGRSRDAMLRDGRFIEPLNI